MKILSNVLEFPMALEKTESGAEEKPTITFLPTDEVRGLIKRALNSLGEIGQMRGTRSKLINDALRVGLGPALEKWGRTQTSGIEEFFENEVSKRRKNGKGR